MDQGRGNGNFIDKIKSLKRKNLLLTLIGPLVIGIIIFGMIIFIIVSTWHRIIPVFTSSSTVGVKTVYDDTYIMDYVNQNLEDWTDEEKFVFTEMIRQKNIWNKDYIDFGIVHDESKKSLVINDYQTNNLDLVKFIVTIEHKGAVNIFSYGTNYEDTNEIIDEASGKKKNDYEGEAIVYHRDTKDFYIQAGKRLGSTFFLFPGLRQLMGNSISANISYKAVHPSYAPCNGGYCLQNLDEILSDWKYLGNMYMNGEESYNNYYNSYPDLGPQKAASIFIDAINYGYDNCYVNIPEDKNDWKYLNICNDYKLIFDENNGYIANYNGDSGEKKIYYSLDLLAQSINDKLKDTTGGSVAVLPIYEYGTSGQIINSNIKLKISGSQVASESSRWFIAVTVHRDNDWDAYDEYLKSVYIPHLYIDCENCNSERSSVAILNEMKQIEKTYRYYSIDDGEEVSFTGGSYETAGSKKIETKNGSYTCDGVQIGISADYVGHKANDLYSGATPTIFPLMEGTVVAVNSSCNTYCPKNDALSYVNRIRTLFQLSPACYCGGGWGNYVKIASQFNGKTIYATYAHLSSVAVSVGQNITYSTPLGIMGTTGVSTGKHLHIELNYTDSSSNKFPPTKLFSTKSVLSTICGGNGNEKEGEDTNE